MNHAYDYECRCHSCVSFELNLRRTMAEEAKAHQAAKILAATIKVSSRRKKKKVA